MAVAGHERHPGVLEARGPAPVMSLPVSSTRPCAGLRSPVSASTSSSWPLPATPAMPRISPARTSNVTPLTASWPRSSSTRRSCTDEGRARGCDSPRSTTSCTLRPTISAARSSSSVSDGMRSPTTLPRRMTVIRSAISRTSYSLWLMKMMRVALGSEPLQDLEDLLRLLRREDRRGLVEDEDPRLAVERLEDLDALLPADRQRLDLDVRDRSRTRTACRAR